ncbi:AHH domain-containing protein [Agaribacter marinus]|uniref:Uncharacterized protein n=1 Tax=Agaribacter marinus TaxID=1431249 RepID=A0AA37SWB8_9ALTE|nr:AHH domain-containing protein [Agaribacter marinus]GLR69360.1 hypothetical protein GCM10007852_02680 [Agaribacter marinus]
MAKTQNSSSYTEIEYEEFIDPTFKALLVQRVSSDLGYDNPYELFNSLLHKQRSKRLYSHGKAKSKSALALHLEAVRDISHSSKLWRNMQSQAKKHNLDVKKGRDEDTHHIVAAKDARAQTSRKVMFSAGIGINDFRNGVNLAKEKHRPMHTSEYYMEVDRRLLLANYVSQDDGTDIEESIGDELLDMADEIANGIF